MPAVRREFYRLKNDHTRLSNPRFTRRHRNLHPPRPHLHVQRLARPPLPPLPPPPHCRPAPPRLPPNPALQTTLQTASLNLNHHLAPLPLLTPHPPTPLHHPRPLPLPRPQILHAPAAAHRRSGRRNHRVAHAAVPAHLDAGAGVVYAAVFVRGW